MGALVVLIGLAHMWVQREHDRLEKNLQKAVLENQRLADVKAKYEASKRKADMFERRVRVIDELKAAQAGPVNLLNLVADTVNSTDAVWLETMTDDGKTLNFTGMALSPNSVADLMANLRKTGAFKSVEIKETSAGRRGKGSAGIQIRVDLRNGPPTLPGRSRSSRNAVIHRGRFVYG